MPDEMVSKKDDNMAVALDDSKSTPMTMTTTPSLKRPGIVSWVRSLFGGKTFEVL